MKVVQLPVSQWGNGTGPRVLLLHGLSGNRGTWWNIAEQLAELGCTVIAPDLRGHGDAPSTSRYQLEDFAADLASLGTNWDLVVGHSLGGPVACLFAKDWTGVAALLLLDPVFEIPEAAFPAFMADEIAEVDPHATPSTLLDAHPKWHPLDAFHKAQAVRSVSAYTVERVMLDNAPWDYRFLPSGLNRPIRILGGDPMVFTMVPSDFEHELAAREPAVSFERVRGAGHSVHRDAPHFVVNSARGMLNL